MLRPSSSLALLTVRHRPAAPEGVSTRAFRRFVTSSTVEYATRLTGQLPGLDFHQQEERPLSAAPTGRLALAPAGLRPTEHAFLDTHFAVHRKDS
jgi:hypothetical protein